MLLVAQTVWNIGASVLPGVGSLGQAKPVIAVQIVPEKCISNSNGF